MFVIVRTRFLGKEKLEKLPGKLENSGKLKVLFSMRFLYEFKTITRDSNDGYAKFFFLFCSLWSWKSFSGKNNREKLQRKFGQTAKIIIIFVCILDHNWRQERHMYRVYYEKSLVL
jgi:hypothetical protein